MPPGSAITSAARLGHHRGVIVPMVTPVTPAGVLDVPAVGRVIEHLHAGGTHGIFVLGTTGEGPFVPDFMREQVVQAALECARGRLLVYAGISSESLEVSIASGNNFLQLGVDAVVAHVPNHLAKNPDDAMAFFGEMVNGLNGDLILYNMPLTTQVSLPIEICKATARRPRVIGIKDSENDAARMTELLEALGGKQDFSVFIGTGPLMGQGLLLGAAGIVPSAGNLAPALCRQLFDSALRGDAAETAMLHEQLMKVSGIYQKGRDLAQSIAALKAAMSCLGLCGPDTLPPLNPVGPAEIFLLREQLDLQGFPVANSTTDESKHVDWAHHGRPGGGRAGAVRPRPV